jgi:hypothetical protein
MREDVDDVRRSTPVPLYGPAAMPAAILRLSPWHNALTPIRFPQRNTLLPPRLTTVTASVHVVHSSGTSHGKGPSKERLLPGPPGRSLRRTASSFIRKGGEADRPGPTLCQGRRARQSRPGIQASLDEPSAVPYAHSLLGTEYLKTKNIPAAIVELREAVRLMTGMASDHANLGYAYCMTGKGQNWGARTARGDPS